MIDSKNWNAREIHYYLGYVHITFYISLFIVNKCVKVYVSFQIIEVSHALSEVGERVRSPSPCSRPFTSHRTNQNICENTFGITTIRVISLEA